jgi:hypothetical protein
MFGWWYVCIGLGFALLAVRSVLRADQAWSIAVRSVIAVGFIALGVDALRSAVAKWRRK